MTTPKDQLNLKPRPPSFVSRETGAAEAHRPGKISIEAQIAEIDYELGQRKEVYKRHPRRENDLHVDRMQAVRATLVWVRDHGAMIRQRASY